MTFVDIDEEFENCMRHVATNNSCPGFSGYSGITDNSKYDSVYTSSISTSTFDLFDLESNEMSDMLKNDSPEFKNYEFLFKTYPNLLSSKIMAGIKEHQSNKLINRTHTKIACLNCKNKKTKCQRTEQGTCNRCQSLNLECIVPEKKQRPIKTKRTKIEQNDLNSPPCSPTSQNANNDQTNSRKCPISFILNNTLEKGLKNETLVKKKLIAISPKIPPTPIVEPDNSFLAELGSNYSNLYQSEFPFYMIN